MFKKIAVVLLIMLTIFLLPVMAEEKECTMSFIPEWSKTVVWYQIFPERFRNGDPTNDPKVENIEGSWPHDHISSWQGHPWTSDWYELQPYEKQNKGFYIITDKTISRLSGKIDTGKLKSIKNTNFSPVTLKDKLVDKGFSEEDIKIIINNCGHDKPIWYDIERG